MAEGLSIPALQSNLGGGLRNLFDLTRTSSESTSGTGRTQSSSDPASRSTTPLGDFFDFGNGNGPIQGFGPGGRFRLAPDGTYQFQSFSAAAEFDLAFSQTTVEVNGGEDDSSVFASLTELNISFSVSAQFEQALIETGRSRGGNGRENLSNAAKGAASRLSAQSIQATLNFELSFSQSTLSINDAAQGLSEDLGGAIPEEFLNGFATLLETFFGDDERFSDFLDNIRGFLTDLSKAFGGEAPPTQGEVAEVPDDLQPVDTFTQEGADPESGLTIQSQRLNISLDLSFESTRIEVNRKSGEQIEQKDPIVLDLDGDGVELTSVQDGVEFDLDNDGQAERTATATGGDGFLALDRNGNGTIDNGGELFGDQNGAANGFEELRKFDSNRDGVIDSRDTIFDQLQVFVDSNRDGLSQSGELRSLSDLGIASINLGYQNVQERGAGGNSIAQRSTFTRNDGSRGQAVDALLNTLV
ncbi:MAG: hypothetical protein H6751_12020 [Candidatus Omnitrophica bacterium]|nr:hypothetical protein [Candidatus Omnitrophota bacterium]